VEITGPDARDFLNRLTTLNFKKWDPLQTRLGAFLTGKSGVVALGFFQSVAGGFHLVLPQDTLAAVLEHIELFHFSEKLQSVDRSAEWHLFGVWHAPVPVRDAWRSWADPFIDGLVWQKVAASEAADWKKRVASLPVLTDVQFDWLRTRSGMPLVGKEVDTSVLVLEGGLERAVDRNKGCYPGQEVVERIFTYGQVNRKLLPVQVTGNWKNAALPLKFLQDGKAVATLVTAVPDLETDSAVGLAFVHRLFWQSRESFQESGIEIKVL
jgi:folate-binding protein YgfZ